MENIENMEKVMETAEEKVMETAEEGKETADGREQAACSRSDAAPAGSQGEDLPEDCRRAAAARILQLLKERGLTIYWLARKTGLSRQTVSNWLHDARRPSTASIERAAMALGVSFSWLLTGRSGGTGVGEDSGDGGTLAGGGLAVVPEYEAAAGGGAGRPALRKFEDGEDASYRCSDLLLRRLDPAKCRRFRVRGDGMEPLVRDGDLVLVDGSERGVRVVDGGVYCLDYGIGPRVRKLSFTRDGGLVMKCLNPAYADESFTAEEAAGRVRIYGRVVERSGWI